MRSMWMVLGLLGLALAAGCNPSTQIVPVGGGTGDGPFVDSVTAAPSGTVLLGQSVDLTVAAQPRVGGTLSYSWSAEQGTITGTGASVTYNAPQTLGTWDVTVSVTEVGGETATRTIPIRVRSSLRR